MRMPVPGKAAASPTWLKAKVAECLNMPARDIDVSAPLTRYGMDSLAAVEIATAIAIALGRKVPESLLWDCPSVESLDRYMATVREGTGSDAAEPVSLRDRMLADSVLPPEIDPGIALPPEAIRSILLTGATGFLGAHVLRTLLLETQATVYCLVRSTGSDDGAARIRQALSSHEIWDASFGPRIRPVPGNIEEPGLGLSPERLDQLARDVDTVYHCAAAVNWVFSYASLRDLNVMGTRHLLELACRHKLKPFHFVSSIAVCYSTAGPREVAEEDDMLPHLHGFHMGYAQSKCVAETLVRAASRRGLPAAIYRPALITGDSKRGISNMDDILSRLIKGCVQMRCAPDLDWILDCCPVDHVADAIVRLSRGGNHAMRVFHLSNPVARHWREGVLWMNLYGYPIRLVPYRQWLAQLATDSSVPAHPLHPLRSFFLERPESAGGLSLPELYEEGRKSRARCDATRSALTEASLSCPPLNARLLDRYFSSFTGRGYLPAVAHRGASSNGNTEVDRDFFTAILRRFHGDDSVMVHAVSAPADASDHSIISELTSWKYGKTAGLRSFSLLAGKGGALPTSVDLMVKIKPRDEEVMEVGESVAALCGDELGRSFARFKRRTGLALCHLRELAVYEQRDERFRRHAPVLYGTVRDDARNAWVLVLEKLKDVELLNSADDISGWSRAHIEAAVRGIADVHAVWYGREAEVLSRPWLGPAFTAAGMAEMRPLWIALAEHCARYFPAVGGSSLIALQRRLIDEVGDWWRPLETLPRTLIHNDFNPRNIALRRTGRELRLCAYDWELAALGVPQHDLAELLCFVLTPARVREDVPYYLEAHRLALERASGRAIDPDSWRRGFRLSLYDLILNRFPMYAMVHTLRRQSFLRRVLMTWRALYDLFPHDPTGKPR